MLLSLRRSAVCAPFLAALLFAAPTALGGANITDDDVAAEVLETAEDSAAGAEDEEMLEAGRLVFTEEAVPSCTVCHALADAETSGQIGPDLDELQPTLERVRQAVTGGVGIMPAYGDQLSEEQIEAVAHYVSTVTADSP